MAWTRVLLLHGLNDPKRDVPRILEAFEALMGECHQWPAPRALIELLPTISRAAYRALPRPELTPEEIAERRGYFRHKAKLAGLDHLLRDEP